MNLICIFLFSGYTLFIQAVYSYTATSINLSNNEPSVAHLALSSEDVAELGIQEAYEISNRLFNQKPTWQEDVFADFNRALISSLIILHLCNQNLNWPITGLKISLEVGWLYLMGGFDKNKSWVKKKVTLHFNDLIQRIQKHADLACRAYGAEKALSILNVIIRKEKAGVGSEGFLDGSPTSTVPGETYFVFDPDTVICKTSFFNTQTLGEFNQRP